MFGTLGIIFSQLVCMGIPLAVLIACIARPKWRVFLKPFLLGVATFVIFQMLTRLPLLQMVLPGQTWYILLRQMYPVWYIFLIGGVTAGLFEECGRFATMHILKPRERTVKAAIAFGLGHGGIEAALITGLPNLLGWFSAPVQVAVMPFWSLAILGVERLLAIGFHVGLSVLVMDAVKKRRWWLLPVAILIHAAGNTAAVLVGQATGNMWLSEAVLVPFTAAMMIYTIIRYKREVRTEVSP